MRPESNAREDTAEKLEPAGAVRFKVNLDESDGMPFKQFTPGGPVEIWLVASEQPLDAAGREGFKFVVLPLSFPNYHIARNHAEGLGFALGALERSIERAIAAAALPIPTLDDGHRHIVRFARYSRTLPFSAECEICMETLVDDVSKWAADRQITTSGDPIAEPWNLQSAIEHVVNRIGEEVDLG